MDTNYLYIAAALGFIAVICGYLFYFKDTNTTNKSTDKKSVTFQTEKTEKTEDSFNCDGEKCPFIPQKQNQSFNCDGEKCVLI